MKRCAGISILVLGVICSIDQSLCFVSVHSNARSVLQKSTPSANPYSPTYNKNQCQIYLPLEPLLMGRRSEKIANRKGKSDLLKAKLYARIGKKIVVAVKQGGSSDIEANSALQDAVREAKAFNVPKDNIDRAIKKGEATDTADFKEITYEAYGHGGIGVIINALTDNPNRAATDIRTAIKKGDLKLADPGSVMYNFERKGMIELTGEVPEDTIFEAALEADVDDFEVETEDGHDDEDDSEEGAVNTVVYVSVPDLSKMRAALDAIDLSPRPSLVHYPSAVVEVSEEERELNDKAVELLEVLDDVDSVETNMA